MWRVCVSHFAKSIPDSHTGGFSSFKASVYVLDALMSDKELLDRMKSVA